MIAIEDAWVDAYHIGREAGYMAGRELVFGEPDNADELLADLLAEGFDNTDLLFDAFRMGYQGGQNLARVQALFLPFMPEK